MISRGLLGSGTPADAFASDEGYDIYYSIYLRICVLRLYTFTIRNSYFTGVKPKSGTEDEFDVKAK